MREFPTCTGSSEWRDNGDVPHPRGTASVNDSAVFTRSKIRILLAEDHRTVRESLRLVLESQRDMQVVGEADDGDAAINLAVKLQPDLVLLDLSMPRMNGLVAARAISQQCPDVRICVLTRHNDEAHLYELLRTGVLGYVLKQSPVAALLVAIRTVAAGREYVDDALTPRMARGYRTNGSRGNSDQHPSLTKREEEVVRQTAWGRSNKEIAQAIGLSVKTIEVHKANAMKKLGFTSRLDIVRYALLKGWLEDAEPI